MPIIPTSITDFNRNTRELQVFWLFCICVAGRNAKMVATKINQLTEDVPDNILPFDWFRLHNVREVLEKCRMGQYTRISKAIEQSLDLDLTNANLSDLEAVSGVGPKTARFFLLHSRPNVEIAVLDTHILKWMQKQITDAIVPKATPQKKDYRFWESVFLNIVKMKYPGTSIADVDLEIWKSFSQKT